MTARTPYEPGDRARLSHGNRGRRSAAGDGIRSQHTTYVSADGEFKADLNAKLKLCGIFYLLTVWDKILSWRCHISLNRK